MINKIIKNCIFTLVLLAALFVIASDPSIAASAPATVLENHYGGSQDQTGETIWQTSDNGYIIVGTGPDTSGTTTSLLLTKVDWKGNQEWNKAVGGTHGYSVRQTSDGGYIATGTDGDYLYLVKTDSSGNKQWEKDLKNGSQNNGYSVQQTSDGGYIVLGEVAAENGNWNMDLFKTDASGNKQWETTYGPDNLEVRTYSVWQTSDGGYIVGGQIETGYNEKPVLVKVDANGNIQWGKHYEGSGDYDNFASEKYGVQQTRDGGYIYAGAHVGALYLLKTDANGNKQWDHDYGVANSASGANSVQQTWDDGYILTGFYPTPEGPYVVDVVRTDSTGKQLWEKTYKGIGYADANSVIQVGNGTYAITGSTKADNNGNNNVYLLLLDKDMTPVPSAKIVSDTIPAQMEAGQAYNVQVTYENDGTMPWTYQDNTTFGHHGDAAKFGVTGANSTIQIGKVIRPGQSETFAFTMTAPGENGTYNPRFQMMWEGHNVFGALDNKTIKVVNGTGPAVGTSTAVASVQATTQPAVSAAASATPTEPQATTVPTATSKPKGGLPCLSSMVLPVLALGMVTISWTMSRKKGSK